jgi:hypothetical protein
MNTETKQVKFEKSTGQYYYPNVTIVLPFNPLEHEKAQLEEHIAGLLKEAETKIHEKYVEAETDRGQAIIDKLKNIVSKLNYNTPKQSVVITVSPVYEKLLYIDLPVEEALIFDEPFEVRDLIYNKSRPDKYLAVIVTAKHVKVFLGSDGHLVKIKIHMPEHAAAFKNDIQDQVANFSDAHQRKEEMLDKFVKQIDKGIEKILKEYPLPIFLFAPERTAGHFMEFSHHRNNIKVYIHGNFDNATIADLYSKVALHLEELKKERNGQIILKIKKAINARKFNFGIESVWHDVMQKMGSLLIIEKNYSFPQPVTAEAASEMNPSFIRDAVDVLIEKVLETGGDVEFVDSDVIGQYGHIGLIEYY